MGTEELLKEIKNKKERKSKKLLWIILAVISIGILAFCSYEFLIKPYLENLVKESAQYGIRYTIYTLMTEAVQCKTIPLTLGNETINLIATACIK